MRLTVASTGAVHLIRSYADGVLLIGEERFDQAVMVGPTLLDGNVPVQNPLELREEHLAAIIAEPPELVVIGWAGGQVFLPAAQRSWFLERRIGLEVMELGAACRTYNVLVQDERRVIALLFPRR
ncbi:MAG: Mth938-like domain-containing protein [Steroidobacteraceae bacterium]